ncbi:DUF3094 family protein [Pseudomonas sp. LRF_L74]|uniref:DUF3094 family protein n=1 Tax=Pseudomonas sp. LRF_L74 TaxID=3369422 RepID=UPI003F609C8A
MSNRLRPEDQQRVDDYLKTSQHQVERKPFRVWRLLIAIILTVIALGLLSRFISRLAL